MGNIQKLRLKNKLFMMSTPYLLCKTSAFSTDKRVDFGKIAIETGTMIKVKFKYGNTNTQPTLNNSLILGYGMCHPENFSAPNSIVQMVYDGTNWIITG